MILSNEYRTAKEAIQWELKSQFQGEPMSDIGLTVNIIQNFKDNKRRDVDGAIKILLDAMTGIIYEDDSQVYELNVIKIPNSGDSHTLIQII